MQPINIRITNVVSTEESFELCVNFNETIYQIKQKIKLLSNSNKIHLVCRGIILDDTLTLQDYGINEKSKIMVVNMNFNNNDVLVFYKDKIIKLSYELSSTILDFKLKIQRILGLSVFEQRLFQKNLELVNFKTFSDYDIGNNYLLKLEHR